MEDANKKESKEKQPKNYRIVRKEIKLNDKEAPKLKDICSKSNNIYNVTNYYIRQLYFGTQKLKNGKILTQNEQKVFDIVNEALPKLDEISKNGIEKKIKELENSLKNDKENLNLKEELDKKKKELKNFKPHHLSKSGFPSYEILDGVFKVTNNPDYRALPIKIIQQTIKQCFQDWKSFFESIKEYKNNPTKFKGMPKPPKYKKKGSQFMVKLTNQVGKLIFEEKVCYIYASSIDCKLDLGSYIKKDAVLQQVEINPVNGVYMISIILLDENFKENKCQPTRMLGIDLGVSNFATISNNVGMTPIIIKGGMLKSRNQYFNKTKAEYLSKLQKGKDSKHSQKHSKRLYALSRNRENFFRDCFYKIAHKIIKIALENEIDTIVIGNKMDGMKQNCNMKEVNNQNFVCIPFCKFISILRYLCLKNGIQFIETEESYTSKSNILNKDILPVFQEGVKTDYKFSGTRVKRGLYKTNNKIILNADVVGASNMVRKANMQAFEGLDLSYLQTTSVLTFRDFYPSKFTEEKILKAKEAKIKNA